MVDQGWFPHDEGALGQSAERVLSGEVPHRDFDELYTGLLSYLHAMTFAVAGVRSLTLRIPLVIACLAWLVAVYQIALRFVPVPGAVLLSLTVLVWSVPVYPAPMPSWYNLFCATWGLLALVKWHESGQSRWLVLAGIAGGVSFLFKLHGLLFVAGALLALISQSAAPTGGKRPRSLIVIQAGVALVAIGAATAWWLVIAPADGREVVRFFVPVVIVIMAVALRELRGSGVSGPARLRAAIGAVGPFVLGAALPVVVFGVWLAVSGALGAAVEGIFVTPFRRLTIASYRPPPLRALWWALPLVWLLWPRRAAGGIDWARRAALVAVLLGLVLYLSGHRFGFYRMAWWSVWSLPLAVAVLAGGLIVAGGGVASYGRGPRGAAVISTAVIGVVMTLIEFPFAAPIYTLYALPIVMLAAAGLVSWRGATPVPLQLVAVGFVLLFGLLRVVPGTVEGLGVAYARSTESTRLNVDRGGLRVRASDAATYEALVLRLRALSRGRKIWAGPDAPEVYFLAGIPNLTRTLVDAFDREAAKEEALAERLDRLDIAVVVIKRRTDFSPHLSTADLAALADRWPYVDDIGEFTVRWR